MIKDYETMLPQIWKVELDILNKIDEFCGRHGLVYTLAYGTLLGGVRHGGFIPWDDDIDIIMPRKDYDKLVKLWDVPGYILQTKGTNNDFDGTFAKIRKDNTTFLQFECEKSVSYHTGIFVDVFQADKAAPGLLRRKIQQFFAAVVLLYSREHISGSNKFRAIETLLLKIPRSVRLKIRKKLESYISRWQNNDSCEWLLWSTIDFEYYPSDLFTKMKKINFCGNEYLCVECPDLMLSREYGNYMELPPENERVLKHKPIEVDFEHNYNA